MLCAFLPRRRFYDDSELLTCDTGESLLRLQGQHFTLVTWRNAGLYDSGIIDQEGETFTRDGVMSVSEEGMVMPRSMSPK
jgi:hypothetical protein